MHRSSRRSFLAQGAAALALGRSVLAFDAPGRAQPLPFGAITPGGDLLKRARQNIARIESDIYRPPLVFAGPNASSWPGDFEGRALLGLTLLARTLGEEPAYLRTLPAQYAKRLNADGLFGAPLNVHAIDEQQLSGHGWLLRGLCEYYEFTHDPQALAMAAAIVKNLALPLRGRYTVYPIDPSLRVHTGGVDGTITSTHGDWVLSSDIGCAFIFLDGLTHAWTLLPQPELKALIDEIIGRFLEIDLVAMGAQTHATLTCLRGLLRMYDHTGDAALLRAVQERYTLYRAVAMTEHYANYNWFGRPETWTEPCAIIDSFMIAHQLWQITGDPAFLEDAHLIWFNGVGRGMRANGGYGTDLCAGYKTPFLKVRSYEAFFCCTMRAGEGHARAIQYTYSTRPGELTVPFFSDSRARLDLGTGTLDLRQTASYPAAGPIRFEVLASTLHAALTLRLFAPRWTSGHHLTLNGRPLSTTLANGFLTAQLKPAAGDVLLLNHDLRVGPRTTLNPRSLQGYYAFEAGPLILAHRGTEEIHIPRNATLVAASPGAYRVAGSNLLLSRINDLNDTPAAPKDPCTRQLLFRPA